jgi:hypothetical protein
MLVPTMSTSEDTKVPVPDRPRANLRADLCRTLGRMGVKSPAEVANQVLMLYPPECPPSWLYQFQHEDLLLSVLVVGEAVIVRGRPVGQVEEYFVPDEIEQRLIQHYLSYPNLRGGIVVKLPRSTDPPLLRPLSGTANDEWYRYNLTPIVMAQIIDKMCQPLWLPIEEIVIEMNRQSGAHRLHVFVSRAEVIHVITVEQ